MKLSTEQVKRVMALYGQSITQQSNEIKELKADNERLSNEIKNIDNQTFSDNNKR